MIIALTGEKLAGKGTSASYLAKKYSAQVFRCSEILENILVILHQEYSRENLVKLGATLRKLYGDDILARVLLSKIQNTNKVCKVIDGLRYQSELDIFNTLPNFHLINITAPMDLRYERTKLRAEKTDEMSMTYSNFVKREQDVTERAIMQLAKQAEETIQNNGTFAELFQKIDFLPFLRR